MRIEPAAGRAPLQRPAGVARGRPARAHARGRPPRRRHEIAARAGPAPGPDARRPTVLAAGGLDAADASVADVVRVAPALRGGSARCWRPSTTSAPPHWAMASTFSAAAAPAVRPTRSPRSPRAGERAPPGGFLSRSRMRRRSPTAARPTSSAGFTTATRRCGRCSPSDPAMRRARSRRCRTRCATRRPRPSAARVLVAGGTDGTTARNEILRVDPARRRVRVIGHLPGAARARRGRRARRRLLRLGGRGDARDSQRRGDLGDRSGERTGAPGRAAAGRAVGPGGGRGGSAVARGRRPRRRGACTAS